MSDTPFKTPLTHCFKRNDTPYTPRVMSEKTDSDESTYSDASSGSSNDLTVVAAFDDLMRLIRHKRDRRTEEAIEAFVGESKLLLEKYCEALSECQRLQASLDLKVEECSEFERRMHAARSLLDDEKKKTQRVLRENDNLHDQLDQVRDLLFKDNKTKIGEEAKEKLAFLNSRHSYDINLPNGRNLSCIQEINSTGSMLSDFSVSRSEDDIDENISKANRKFRKSRPNTERDPEPPLKKRRSTDKIIEIGLTDTIRATTTVTVNKRGPITTTSVIESLPQAENGTGSDAAPSSDDGIMPPTAANGPPPHLIFESWDKHASPRGNIQTNHFIAGQRQHVLQPKTMVMSDICICCDTKIRFGKTALKCKECRSLCHNHCHDKLPLPCIPVISTPNHKHTLCLISDYTLKVPPMVPALIIHCTNEIELRGLKEMGIYRISASEKEVKSLKERFLKGRGSPALSQIDIHIICGCVKDFFRGLAEPLVTFALWKDFARAVEARDPQDIVPALYHCISQLPQPNRDTMAYMMLHLQKVAEAPDCKMPIENLAKVFGPTLVGYSSDNPNKDNLMTETRLNIAVIDRLMRLPSEYWIHFVNVDQQSANNVRKTPSTQSLPQINGRLFTPGSARSAQKRKIFNTPPAYRYQQ